MAQHEQNALDYFGARYLDPMLGMWTSVDPKRQFASPYLYAGNGLNPIIATDNDGNVLQVIGGAALGVLTGMVTAYIEASLSPDKHFHYSLADGITDAAVGALGIGAIKNAGRALKGLSKMGKIKLDGRALHRNKWKNKYNAAKDNLEKGAIKATAGVLTDEYAPQIMEDYAPGLKETAIDYDIPDYTTSNMNASENITIEPAAQASTIVEKDFE